MRACMLPRASAAIALSLLFGCAAFEHDKSQPREKLALVKAGQWGKAYRGGYVELASVPASSPIGRHCMWHGCIH